MPCYIYQLPAWVLDDLCRNMDTLSEWDWMQFASYVITDLTELRKIKSMERVQGVSITRELLWRWGMRQATVRQLLHLLRRLELHRAAQIILDWKPVPDITPPSTPPSPLGTETPGWLLAASVRTTRDQAQAPRPAAPQGPGPKLAAPSLLLPPAAAAPPLDPLAPGLKGGSRCPPQQEVPWSVSGDSLSWSEASVVLATDDFPQDGRLGAGALADVYRGHLQGVPLAVKRLREVAGSGLGSGEKFFQAELQLCRRCCHPNVLPLLGFCTEPRLQALIHPYMANGSLQDRLRAQDGSVPLPWPQRVRACLGLLRALCHLHSLDLIHGNVKSSNVLLDQDFAPKLAHPTAPLCPEDRRSQYTLTKTQPFRASAAYLPEDFIRVGRLTKRVDVFGCGVVLAEVLTGIPAVDTTRSPEYLKDLVLSEIPGSSGSLCSSKGDVERATAKELSRRFLDGRAGRLPEDCAEALALAACVCLRRRQASLEEVCGPLASVGEQLRAQQTPLPWSRLSEGTGCSSNTPEETDDVDGSSFSTTSSRQATAWVRAAASPSWKEDGEGRLQAAGTVEAGSLEACASQEPPRGETSWKIEINEAKRKLMQDILLYAGEKLDSTDLFGPR